MEASQAQPKSGYLDFSRLHPGELIGILGAGVLALSLFLPWFSPSDTNPNSVINGERAPGVTGGPPGDFNAFDTFATLHWWLLAACSAPLILAWIVARGHTLTWRPGEITMIVGITAFVLILLNGVVLGKPGESVEVGFMYGYAVAMLGAIGICAGGYLRQAEGVRGRKPPGTL
jgi:hypothetical protein